MRNGLYVLFCIVIPAIAIADADCSKKEGFSDVEYLLICDNGRDNISSLKDRVHEEFDFFKKWRSGKDINQDAQLVEAHIEAVEGHIARAELAIQELAHVECIFEEYPGFRPSSGSSAQNYGLCTQEIVNRKMISILERALLYMSVEKPSFDCKKTGTEIEVTICESNYLSLLERKSYEALSNKRGAFLSVPYDQDDWMHYLRDSCSGSPSLGDCLGKVMNSRLEGL